MQDQNLLCFLCPSCNWIGNSNPELTCPKCKKALVAGYFAYKEPRTLMTCDPVFVAFLDILGFKNMVKNNPIQSLFQVYSNFLTRMEKAKEFTDLSLSSLKFKKSIVNSLFVSDSLIFWTEDFSQTSLYDLVGLTALLLAESFLQGTPLRGAINMGEIGVRTTSENRTIVGPGLTSAYEIENTQEWSGCVVSGNCLDHFNKMASLSRELPENYLLELNLLINYPIPLKEDQTQNGFAINWLSMTDKNTLTKDIIIESFAKFNKNPGQTVQKKITNTIKFYDEIQDKTLNDYMEKIKAAHNKS